MNYWKTLPSIGGILGIVFSAVSVLVSLLVAALSVTNALAANSAGANIGTFFLGLLACVLILLSVLLIWRTWRFFQLRYYLDRNAVTVSYGDSRFIIPLGNVTQVATAESLLHYLKQQINAENSTSSAKASTEKAAARGQSSATDAADSSGSEPFEVSIVEVEPLTDAPADSSPDTEIVEAVLVEEENLEATEISEPEASQPEAATVAEVTPVPEAATTATSSSSTATATPKAATNPAISTLPTSALAVKMGGLRWPGYYFNHGYFPSIGQIKFLSTAPFAQTVIVRTDRANYALSPRDPQKFVTELKLRRNLGATEQQEEGVKAGTFLSHPLWHDWVGRILIGVGVAINLILFFVLLLNFNTLPGNVELHFNKFGDPDRIGVTGDLMWLPFVGLIAVVANSALGAWLQTRDKVPAYVVYAASIMVQFLIVLALFGILGGTGAATPPGS